jgi:hypothetical protein
MAIGLAPIRPPFVEFKQVAIEDRQASLDAGRRVTRNENHVYIRQLGDKDVFVTKADEWLSSIKKKSILRSHDAFPEEWVEKFHRNYDLWKQGIEAPIDGTSIKEFPVLSPAECENLITLKIFTIEDLASLNEDGLRMIGIGGRALRDKARQWCSAQSQAEIQLTEMQKQIEELKAQLAAVTQPDTVKKRGRPPKVE